MDKRNQRTGSVRARLPRILFLTLLSSAAVVWVAPGLALAQNTGHDASRSPRADHHGNWNPTLWPPEEFIARQPQLASSAIGMTVREIVSAYPAVDCSMNLCEFGKDQPYQQLCPDVGACSSLALVTNGRTIIGYIASFSRSDWAKALHASARLFGQPQVQSNQLESAHINTWTWQLAKGFELTYMASTGRNLYGVPMDGHSILITPRTKR